jgi:hypothetical protein
MAGVLLSVMIVKMRWQPRGASAHVEYYGPVHRSRASRINTPLAQANLRIFGK